MDIPGTPHPAMSANPFADDPRFPINSPLSPRRVTIQLDRLPVGTTINLPPGLDQAALSMAIDRQIPAMVATLSAKVLAHELPPEEISRTRQFTGRETGTLPCPATWRDMFKLTYRQRWWMRFLTRFLPIHAPRIVDRLVHVSWQRTETMRVDLRRYRTFPEATVRFPDNMGPALLACTVETSWDRQR